MLIDLLAGLGLGLAWRALRVVVASGIRAPSGRSPSAALGLLLAGALLAAAWPSLAVAPYFLSYYNPLLGGGPAAVRAVPVGRGEGFDRVAAFVNAQPDGASARVAIFFEFCVPLNPLLDGSAARDDQPAGADSRRGRERRPRLEFPDLLSTGEIEDIEAAVVGTDVHESTGDRRGGFHAATRGERP